MPLLWILSTGFKSSTGFDRLPTQGVFPANAGRLCQSFHDPDPADRRTTWQRIRRDLVRGDRAQAKGMVIAGPSRFGERFMNSVIIGFGSTFLSVFLGTLAAYAFSRLPHAAERRPAVLYPLDTDDATDRRRHSDFFDVSVAWFEATPMPA